MDIHIYVSLYLLLFWDISCSLFSPLLLVLFHIVIILLLFILHIQLYSIYFDEMMRSGRDLGDLEITFFSFLRV